MDAPNTVNSILDVFVVGGHGRLKYVYMLATEFERGGGSSEDTYTKDTSASFKD